MEVKRVNERLMMVRVAIGEKVINVISAYAPQVRRPYHEKEEFWSNMRQLLSSTEETESIFVGGDLNGHVGEGVDGFDGVHGGNGYGKRNTEGEMLLEFAMAMDLIVCNTFFKKEVCKKVTFESGENRSEVDFILVRRKDKSSVKDVTVINGETCVTQHKLLLCKIEVNAKLPNKKKTQFRNRCRLWRLNKKDISAKFEEEIRLAADKRTVGDVDSTWN